MLGCSYKLCLWPVCYVCSLDGSASGGLWERLNVMGHNPTLCHFRLRLKCKSEWLEHIFWILIAVSLLVCGMGGLEWHTTIFPPICPSRALAWLLHERNLYDFLTEEGFYLPDLTGFFLLSCCSGSFEGCWEGNTWQEVAVEEPESLNFQENVNSSFFHVYRLW